MFDQRIILVATI
ncbi:hypothetical protein F383_33716 [Gossypium arboreum]|uniref:Uncharacterized protein n=1 Tax=Gossypium arboreum TaxID=29729 RepID=A0A0B0PQ60_GOSAR|nr:hypothetical protein F383_33716 [Gossypium arboreum]